MYPTHSSVLGSTISVASISSPSARIGAQVRRSSSASETAIALSE